MTSFREATWCARAHREGTETLRGNDQINKEKRLLLLVINMYVIQGPRSQFDEKFKNRGVQCTAIAVVSCCKAFLSEPSAWSGRDIDECLEVQVMQFCGYVYVK